MIDLYCPSTRSTVCVDTPLRILLSTLFLSLFATLTPVTAQQVPLEKAKLSPTLYFSDASSELTARQRLHISVVADESAIRNASPASLITELDRAWKLISDLQRHAAYLKVQGLEDSQNVGIKRARESVDGDKAVLESAIQKRLAEVPLAEISSLGPYALLASEVRDEASHLLAPEAEQYRSVVTTPHEEAISDAYDQLIASLGSFKDMTSLDLTKRRSATTRRNEVFDTAAPATAGLLAALIDMENRDASAQMFANAADRKYQQLGLSTANVDAVLASVASEAPVYRHYQHVIAQHASKRLGVYPILSDELALESTDVVPIPLAEGRHLILDALKPLGADYTNRFASLLDPANGRLDLTGGPNRAHTGTSIAVYDAPVALYFTGYDDSLDSLGTIAHEGGHAIQRELMNLSGIPIYQREGPHYLFEGIAIFNELLLLDHMEAIATTPAAKRQALENLLHKIAFELFTSAEETTFEKSLYVSAAGKGLLDRARIDALYREAITPYEEFALDDVGASQKWMRKSLVFEDPLYLVNYLYAALVAVSLYERQKVDVHFSDEYENLLRRGFYADPQTLLAPLGIRLDDPELLKSVASLFQSKTVELEALYTQEQ